MPATKPARKNPLKLNALQLKTLTILQAYAEDGGVADADTGDVQVTVGKPHGDHFHVGPGVVLAKDASGLDNPGVWKALERKGLAKPVAYPRAIALTPAGRDYDTGLREEILHLSDH